MEDNAKIPILQGESKLLAVADLENMEPTRDKNRAQRRARRQGISKHSRFMILNGKLIKISLTKRRPWVVKDERRKANKVASDSRRKNR